MWDFIWDWLVRYPFLSDLLAVLVGVLGLCLAAGAVAGITYAGCLLVKLYRRRTEFFDTPFRAVKRVGPVEWVELRKMQEEAAVDTRTAVVALKKDLDFLMAYVDSLEYPNPEIEDGKERI